jgi:hypothetical protein
LKQLFFISGPKKPTGIEELSTPAYTRWFPGYNVTGSRSSAHQPTAGTPTTRSSSITATALPSPARPWVPTTRPPPSPAASGLRPAQQQQAKPQQDIRYSANVPQVLSAMLHTQPAGPDHFGQDQHFSHRHKRCRNVFLRVQTLF